ncbi:PD40 domain-containing protein, partial [Arthrobacter sp. H5]|uniref:S41 family peptidase n=1 Tax=Arthrobacter sp. H5 TaxID=1267973 RepID=UPI00055EC51B
ALQQPVRNPRFSPDGSVIAWTAVQGGAPEVVAANTDGGDFRRLTYWGHQSTKVKGFTAGGDVIATSAFRHEDPRHAWAYRVPLDGSGQTVFPYGPLEAIVHGEALGDERPVVIASVMTREQAWWKRYRGGTAGKLWLDSDGSGDFSRFLPELDGNLTDPMWVGGRLAFLSDHEGYGNLYSVTADGDDLQRHTDHEEFYVRHAATDGSRVVFESAGTLWLLDSLDAAPVALEISLGSASTARRPQALNVAKHLASAVPLIDGSASVVESHGTLHLLTHKDGPSRVVEATAGVRARLGRPVGRDSVAYIADHDGEEALYIRRLFGTDTLPEAGAQPDATASGETSGGSDLPAPVPAGPPSEEVPDQAEPAAPVDGDGPEATVLSAQDSAHQSGLVRVGFDGPFRASNLCVSPSGETIAIAGEMGQILIHAVGTGSLFELSSTPHGAIDHLDFSPDSKWLTWAEPVTGEGARTRIRLAQVSKGADIHDVTDGRFRDHAPSFTRDCRFLAFLSDRSFDPVYDTHRFDLSFPVSTKPFLVALAAETPSPFGPAVHDGSEPTGNGDGADEAPAVIVDGERLAERIITVPVAQGGYSGLRAVKDALLWTSVDSFGVTGDGRATTDAKDPASRLERFDLAGRTVDVLVQEVDSFTISSDGSSAVVIHGGKMTAVPTKGKVEADSQERVEVELNRIRVLLDPPSVWRQAFDEAWRLQRDFFWAEDMGGLDWKAIHARYLPLVGRIASHDDLVDVLWELHGELGTSHAYVTPALASETGSGPQGFLGAELEPTDRGWSIRRIFDGESSDPQA